jgi:hypothetical protein
VKLEKITAEHAKDTGLAITLILLLTAHFGEFPSLILPAVAVLVLTMTWPAAFRPLAHGWFGLSRLLGSFVSKILLAVIFFALVTPVGLIMTMIGKDSMRLKAWRNGQQSVFVKRDHTFTAEDLEQPY